jgi:hypothetical protein
MAKAHNTPPLLSANWQLVMLSVHRQLVSLQILCVHL